MRREYIERVLSEYEYDEEEVCSVFGEKDFSGILDIIYSLPEAERSVIFSKEKKFRRFPVLKDEELNRKGLYIFRVVLAEAIYDREMTYNLHNDYIRSFYEDGMVIIPDFIKGKELKRIRKKFYRLIAEQPRDRFDNWKHSYLRLNKHHEELFSFFNNPELIDLVRMANGRDDFVFHDKRVERLVHRDNDIQKQIHEDTFHPTIKFWFYLAPMTLEQGPTRYVKGSHRSIPGRLAWSQKLIIDAYKSSNKGTREGSFRASAKEIKAMGYRNSITAEAIDGNSLVIVNTRGFHARGIAKDGTVRDAMTGLFRMNPFWMCEEDE